MCKFGTNVNLFQLTNFVQVYKHYFYRFILYPSYPVCLNSTLCMLSDGTQHCALSFNQKDKNKIINSLKEHNPQRLHLDTVSLRYDGLIKHKISNHHTKDSISKQQLSCWWCTSAVGGSSSARSTTSAHSNAVSQSSRTRAASQPIAHTMCDIT